MSRYAFPDESTPSRYRCVVGYDPATQTFFAQVTDGKTEKGGDSGVSPPLLLWLGAEEQLTGLDVLRDRLAPYASIPQAVSADMIRDRALDQNLPFPEALTALTDAVHNDSPANPMVDELDPTKQYYLFVDQRGCHIRDWATLPSDATERDSALRRLVYGEVSPLPAYLEVVTGYFRSTSLLLRLDEYGVRKCLPLYVALPRRGMSYPGPVGPVIVSYPDAGLTVSHIRRLLSEQLLVLDPAVRNQATQLYYSSPLSRTNIF